MQVRLTRYSFMLAGVMALGATSLVRPGAAQEPPTSLPSCPAGSGETLDGLVVDLATRVPLAGADIAISVVGGPTRRSRSTVNGRFRFCEVPAGERIELSAVYASVGSRGRSVIGGNRGEPVEVVVDLGAPSNIVVAVTDADTGQPIEGVTVRLQPGVIAGVTNEGGRLRLGRVPPGEYRLRADHLAFRSFAGPVFVAPDEPRQLDVALAPQIIVLDTLKVIVEGDACARPGFTTVSGTVVDRRTKIPLAGAIVSASRFGDEGFMEERAQSEDDGTFFLCGLPIGSRFRLAATLGSRKSEGEVIRVGRERGAIVLEIDHGRPAFLVMRVTDGSTGFPVEGAMIRLRPHPLGGITDDNGLTGFRKVPPGDYEVRVDHIAYASFEGTMNVRERSHDEYAIELQPTAISVEPLVVRVTGRDPYLVNNGFYDRMAELEDAYFYDYWDMEPYASLSMFLTYKTWIFGAHTLFLNGRPLVFSGQPIGEIKFREIRGVEHMRCRDLPPKQIRYLDLFDRNLDYCWAVLIWQGEGRVREQRKKPTDRCANERREEALCSKETGS